MDVQEAVQPVLGNLTPKCRIQDQEGCREHRDLLTRRVQVPDRIERTGRRRSSRPDGSSRPTRPASSDQAAIGLSVPLAEQVRCYENSCAAACGCPQFRVKEAAPVRIEAEPGLVEHQYRRVGQREHGERQTLARAAGQPRRWPDRAHRRAPTALRRRRCGTPASRGAARRTRRISPAVSFGGSAATGAGTRAARAPLRGDDGQIEVPMTHAAGVR